MQNEVSDDTYTQLLARPLNAPMRAKLKACQQVVKTQSQKLGMAPELLARKKTLQNQLLMYKKTGELLWEGELAAWRREILEPEFIRIYSEA
jgi:ribonuclease D